MSYPSDGTPTIKAGEEYLKRPPKQWKNSVL
jgi:hypothetical protein